MSKAETPVSVSSVYRTSSMPRVPLQEPLSYQEKERVPFPFDVLIITGDVASGKTTVRKTLAKHYSSMGKIRVFSAGEEFRRRVKEATRKTLIEGGEPVPTEIRRLIDEQIEEKISNLILNAHQEGPIIIESRTAALVAKKLEKRALEEGKQPSVVRSFFLTVSKEEQNRRILERERSKNPNLGDKEILAREHQRAQVDPEALAKSLAQIDPKFKKINIMNPDLEYNGERVYTPINTDTLKPEEVAGEINFSVQEAKWKEESVNPPPLPTRGDVFRGAYPHR